VNHITKQYRSPDATHLRLLAGELETRRTGLALALLLLGSRRTLALTLALGSVNASLLGLAGTALGFRRDSVGSLAFDLGAGRLLTLLREPAAGLLQDPSDVDLPLGTSLQSETWLGLGSDSPSQTSSSWACSRSQRAQAVRQWSLPSRQPEQPSQRPWQPWPPCASRPRRCGAPRPPPWTSPAREESCGRQTLFVSISTSQRVGATTLRIK
jgi:hypothetical protein